MPPTEAGRAALAAVQEAGVLAALAPYDATVVGAFPLGLERDGSDVDVLCHAPDLEVFARDGVEALATRHEAVTHRRPAADGQAAAVVVRFHVQRIPVEVFAQPVPIAAQRGYRHLRVEQRLLALGGPSLFARLRAARGAGGSVEHAFARVLGLPGDPYLAVLALEDHGDDQLRALLDGALG